MQILLAIKDSVVSLFKQHFTTDTLSCLSHLGLPSSLAWRPWLPKQLIQTSLYFQILCLGMSFFSSLSTPCMPSSSWIRGGRGWVVLFIHKKNRSPLFAWPWERTQDWWVFNKNSRITVRDWEARFRRRDSRSEDEEGDGTLWLLKVCLSYSAYYSLQVIP